MALDVEQFSIVLVGAMNPRIHHPAWYHHVGLIDETERDAAIENAATICTTPLSTFQSTGFTISCELDRWTVVTDHREGLARIASTTARIFDEVLPQTPVRALGFNVNIHRTVEGADVPRRLARRLMNSNLGLTEPFITSASCWFMGVAPEGRQVTVRLEPSVRSKDMIFVAHNFHYEFESSPTPKQFEIKPILDRRVTADLTEAEKRVLAVAAAVASLGE